MPESYPLPPDRSSPSRSEFSEPASQRFQFRLITLVFWMTVCATGAGIVKMFVDRGNQGVDYLLVYLALGSWLAVTWIAILIRVYSPQRWQRARAHRRELEDFVRRRRAAQRRERQQRSEDSSSPSS